MFFIVLSIDAIAVTDIYHTFIDSWDLSKFDLAIIIASPLCSFVYIKLYSITNNRYKNFDSFYNFAHIHAPSNIRYLSNKDRREVIDILISVWKQTL